MKAVKTGVKVSRRTVYVSDGPCRRGHDPIRMFDGHCSECHRVAHERELLPEKIKEKICQECFAAFMPRNRHNYVACLECEATWRRKRKLRDRYGLTHDQYDAMLAAQDYKCAICKTGDAGKGKKLFSVDHCHTTGSVRGLLCDPCNNLLGRARDNVAVLLNAVAYLRDTAHKRKDACVVAKDAV